MPKTPATAIWLLILTVALALRLGAGVWWQARLPAGDKFLFADSLSYWSLARQIADGGAYQYDSPDYRVFRTPGYPLLLAGLFRVFGGEPPVMWARALSAAWGTLAVGLVGWWTTQLFDARAGRVAGWIAALYPGSASMGALVLSEATFCPWMLGELVLWGLAWRAGSSSRSAGLAAGAGACGAIATLVRPSWLLFTPFAIIAALVIAPQRGRQLVIGGALCVGLVAGMLPWWLRNAEVTGRFVPTTLQVGASLFDGLNPAADGGSNMDFVPRFTAEERLAEGGASQADTFEYRLDRRLAGAAVAWARANPGRAVELAGIKFLRTWNVWPNESSFRAWPLRLVVLATYTPLLALALVGIWRFTRRGWPYVLAWLPAVYFTLLHMVFVGSIRYREPAMLGLIVLAAGLLAAGEHKTPEADGKARAAA